MNRSSELLRIVAFSLATACADRAPVVTAADASSAADASRRDAAAPAAVESDAAARPAIPAPDFGANVTSDGGVRFRVWAPNATAAAVIGDFAEIKAPMNALANGVFEAVVPSARAGTRYSFELVTPEGTVGRLDPYCRALELDRKACRVVDPNLFSWKTASFERPARNQSILYEMHVGSFTSQGTFGAAAARLAALADLGVNVVELMPVHAFGGTARTWGYNPHLWLAPKPEYGTPDELRAFVDEAHRLGIAVWIDVVLNHYDGWSKAPLWCFDGLCPGDSPGVYFFDSGPHAQTPWGPRPDYTKPEVSAMLRTSIEQWLLEYRGDGFRWDSVSNIRASDGVGSTPGGRELIVDANERTRALGAITVAEDLKGLDAITKTTTNGGFGFDAQWDGFVWDVGALLASNDDARDLGVLERALLGGYGGDGFARVIALETHDTVGNGGARLSLRVDGGNAATFKARKLALLGGVMLLSTPAVPMLFMGQEWLATDGFSSEPPTLAAPTTAGSKVRAFYKDMIALRRSLPDLANAAVEVSHRNDGAKVLAYRRGDVVVIVNLRSQAYERYDVGVPNAGPWQVALNTDSKKYGDDFGAGQTGSVQAMAATKDGEPYTLRLRLGPYSAMLLTH